MVPGEDLRLRIYPDPVLRQRATPIADVNDEVRSGARQMFLVMYEHGGIGLAGPQVGWGKRIFVVNVTGDAEEPQEERVFINPEISGLEEEEVAEEGCLSIPDLRADVVRSERIHIAATGLDGEAFELDADGIFARCLQHELDHLDGILIINRLSIASRLALRRPLKELERKFKEEKRAG